MIEIKSISNKSTRRKKAILAIVKSLPDFFNKPSIEQISRELETHMISGSFAGDQLVGFITLRQTDSQALEISWLAVLSKYQGQGVGYDLVKSTLNKMAQKGFTVCYVKTLAETDPDPGYAKTREFYKSLGFNTLEIIFPYPGWKGDNPCQILAVALPIH